MSLFSGWRQFLYPREFRITPLKLFDLNTILRLIANLPEKDVSDTTRTESLQFIIDFSLSLWRLQQKLMLPNTEQPLPEMRRAYNTLTSIWNSLIQAGISVREHNESLYHQGLSLSVAGYREVAGITQPIIVETIKPTVYLQDNPIYFGEVIVGIPSRIEK